MSGNPRRPARSWAELAMLVWIVALALLPVLRCSALAGSDEGRPLASTTGVTDPAARQIMAQPTLRHALPPLRLAGSRRAYEFLLDHPVLTRVTDNPGGLYREMTQWE
ncbi:MAG: hypothetical protein KGJ40_05410 [candidate division NC10 bacterium]|nr:hypothetical protein [candidate division NC10 bacterium]